MTKEQLADELESNLPEKDEGGGSVVSNELIKQVVDELRGASSDDDRATAAEPEVSALRDGIPSAEDV